MVNSNTNEKQTVSKRDVLWNMAGSIVSSAASFLLLIFVTRTVGTGYGGVFSLAYSTAQILLTFGKFGIRSFQATDVKGQISVGTYLTTRIFFCIGMILFDAIYIFAAGYNKEKALIFILVCLIKMVDALEDVFHGQLQREGHLDKAGMLLFARNMLTIIVFGGCMYGLKDLMMASLVTAVTSIVSGLIMNCAVSQRFYKVEFNTDAKQITILLRECFPLFLGTFLSLFIYNVPKYVIDFKGTDDEIAIYSILFMPTFVINLFSDFIFKPLLTTMAYHWDNNENEKLWNILKRQFVLIGGIMVAVLAGAFALGTQVLSLVYKVDVSDYRSELMILMVAGGLSALVYLLYNVLTCMRKQMNILCGYAVGAVIITVLAIFMMGPWKIMGEAMAYLVTEVVLGAIMLIPTIYYIKKND